MKSLLIFIFLFGFKTNLYAQTADSIRTGRPGQAIGPFVVGTHMFQLQTGMDGTFTNQPGLTKDTFTLNNVLRFGLSEDFEISGVFNYQQDHRNAAGVTSKKDGISDAHLGFRYNVVDSADGWLPAVGLQTRFRLKTVSNNYKRNEMAPVILLALSNPISESLSLTTNLGIDYNGVSAAPIYRYVFSFSHALNSRVGLAYELYGNQEGGDDSVYGGLGFYYLVHSDFQLDIYASGGNNHGVDEIYSSVGFSWRDNVFS